MDADGSKTLSIKPGRAIWAGFQELHKRMQDAEPWRTVQTVDVLRRALHSGLVAEGVIPSGPDKGGLSGPDRPAPAAPVVERRDVTEGDAAVEDEAQP